MNTEMELSAPFSANPVSATSASPHLCVNPLASLFAAFFLTAVTASADITMPALAWTPSNNKVSISGNIATIALPGTTKQSGYVRTPFDMSSFVGKAFDLTINASLEGVGGLTYSWEGLKFQFSFYDDLRGANKSIDGASTQKEGTTTGWEQLRIHFDPSKYSSTSGTLSLGIQSAYGTARFDLSTLAIRETPAICEATNQNLVVSYPARMRDMPQKKGVMSPTGDMNEGDFRTLNDWGATLLRFQMASCPSSAITNVPAYLEWVHGRLDHLEGVVLPNAEKYGILVLLDLHSPLGGRLGGYHDFALMDDDVFYEAWIDLWREIATRFKGDKRIYGYDLCNEPNQASARKRSYWQIQQGAAEAIREIDPDATIVMEADAKDAPDAFYYLSPLSLDNVVYQVHMYEPGTYTHQGLDGNPYGAIYPGTLPDGKTFDKAWLREQLAPVRAFQQKHHVRILMGEFSAICWAPGAETYLKDLTDICNEYGWDWCYHAFREWGGWSLEHQERNAGEPTQWDFVASPGNARKSAVLAGLAAGAGAEAVSDYLRLESERTVTLQNATNDNAAVIQRIVFAGGSLRGTSFNGHPLCTANGARWRLESEDGSPILIGDIGVQRQHWHTGDGFVETRGDAQVVLYTTSYHDTYGRGIVWFDDARTAWDHTGNFVISNAVQVVCRADNCLPHGNGTGGIRLTWVNRKIPAPILDLGGHRVAVNEINSGGGILTNSAATRATLRFGENDMGGLLTLGSSQDCGNIDIETTGAGQNGLDVGSSSFGAVSVEDGRFLVRGKETNTVTLAALSVASKATFIVTGTTVRAASYFPAGAVQLRGTGRLLYDTLVVAEGAPLTLDTNEDCAKVLLRDSLTLASGGTLASPLVEVDGLGGGLVVDGGTFPGAARLRLADALAASPGEASGEAVATVLALRTGTTTLQCATNANSAVAARILFLGGSVKCTSFSGKPLCAENGGKWILEGSATSPIRFGDLGLQRMYWLTGDGSVETRGDCDVVFDDSNYNVANDYRGTIWLNASNTAWNNAGDLVLSNAIHVICRADNCLPAGPQTGVVRMKWVKNRLPAPILDLNGHSVAVNGIDTTAGGIVTNSSRVVATLRVGEGDTSGQITLPPLTCGNIGFIKRGAGTNTLDIGSSDIASLSVEAGTLVVAGTAADTLRASSVSVAEGATLVIDGATLFVPEISGPGTVERLNGGTTILMAIGDNGSDDTIVWDNPSIPSGSALIKVGSNRAIVQTEAAIGNDIDVRGGTMVFSGRTCTNEWYKFVFNGSQYNIITNIAIGDLRVYSGTTKNAAEEVAHGIGANGKVLTANTAASSLQPGYCVASFATASKSDLPSDAKADIWDLRNAFDTNSYKAVVSKLKYYIYNNKAQQWVAFRMAAGKNRVQSYLPVKSELTWYWHPSAWLFQTSTDGVNWQTVDTRTGAISSSGYGSTPFVIKGFLADGAAGFDSSANVKVASGATLDATGVAGGQTLSRLTIDMTAGAGTISGVTIAQGGILNLVDVPAGMALRDLTLPIVLQDVTDGGNFALWTVRVNGVETNVGVPKWNRETGAIGFSSGFAVFILH